MINNDISAASPGVSEPGPPRRRLQPRASRRSSTQRCRCSPTKGLRVRAPGRHRRGGRSVQRRRLTHFASKEDILGTAQAPNPAAHAGPRGPGGRRTRDRGPSSAPLWNRCTNPSVIPQCCRPCACCWLTARACRRPSTNGTRPCLSRTSPMWRACSSVVSGGARCVAVYYACTAADPVAWHTCNARRRGPRPGGP